MSADRASDTLLNGMSMNTTCPACGMQVGFDHTGAMNRHGTLDTGECPGGRTQATA